MRFLVVITVAVLLAACGPRLVQTDVTRFTASPSGPAPGTVTIVPTPNQRGSLEFQSYAEMVAQELSWQGFQPVPADAVPPPDYEVLLTWGVGDPVTEVHSTPGTVFGGTSVFGSRTGFGLGVGIPLGYDARINSTTVYPKWLQIRMRTAAGMSVFEGRAVTDALGASVQPAIPYLIEAVFTNFPGRSGTTERVRLPQR